MLYKMMIFETNSNYIRQYTKLNKTMFYFFNIGAQTDKNKLK